MQGIRFFDPPTIAEEQEQMRNLLAYIVPANADDVKMVAAALKTSGDKFEGVFLHWAKPYGRFKAKGLWLKARPDPDALEEVAERQMIAAKQRSRFQPRTAAEVGAMAMVAYRLKPILPAEGLAVVYGASGSAKSFLCTELAAAIAEGEPFFGNPTTAAPVLYIGLEGEWGFRARVLAWQRHHARAMSDRLRFLLQPFRLTDPQDVSDLASTCPPGCVVFIDTLNRAAPGLDENSSKDMGHVIEGAKAFQRSISGLVVLIAHTGKDATKGLRGHSSLFAALDAAILVSRDGDTRRWKVDKAKDGRDGDDHAFRLKVVDLGTDDDGDPVSSCVVLPDHTYQVGHAKPLTGNRHIAMATLHQAAGSGGLLDQSGGFAGVPLPLWRDAFYSACPAENDDAKRKAFNRARTDLVEMGLIAVDNDAYRFAGPNGATTNAVIAAAIAGRRDSRGTLA